MTRSVYHPEAVNAPGWRALRETCDVTCHFRRKRFRMLRVDLSKTCILAGLAVTGWAQPAPPVREIPLYPGVAPGSENWNYPERSAGTADRPQAQNIVRPVLLYYPAEKATAVGTAMIVAPGGGAVPVERYSAPAACP